MFSINCDLILKACLLPVIISDLLHIPIELIISTIQLNILFINRLKLFYHCSLSFLANFFIQAKTVSCILIVLSPRMCRDHFTLFKKFSGTFYCLQKKVLSKFLNLTHRHFMIWSLSVYVTFLKNVIPFSLLFLYKLFPLCRSNIVNFFIWSLPSHGIAQRSYFSRKHFLSFRKVYSLPYSFTSRSALTLFVSSLVPKWYNYIPF